MNHVTAAQLAVRLADAAQARPLLLDVREDWEVATCQIPGSIQIAMNTIPGRINELDEDAEIVCICHHGARSAQVGAYLERQGFTRISNLTGGVHAWAVQVDSTMPTY